MFYLLPALETSLNRRELSAGGRPFFWLADTAWEMLHRWNREEIGYYLQTRAAQGFNVIQTVLLAELDGLRVPNRLGLLPLLNQDPTQPNPDFFGFANEVFGQAEQLGLYVAVLPTWGDKVLQNWGLGPLVFTLEQLEVARRYGAYLGQRYRERSNLIWVLGGDREVVAEGCDYRPVWRALAEGIRSSGATQLMSYHPRGGPETPAQVATEPWLDFLMFQSGHAARNAPIWDWMTEQSIGKPMLDGEICYEDHGVNPWKLDWPHNDYFRDLEVRQQAYRSVFAGGCGVSYGHHSVWQAYAPDLYQPEWYPECAWREALLRPAAWQMLHLRRLIESRPVERIPAQHLLLENGLGGEHQRVSQAHDQSCLMVYLPQNGQRVRLLEPNSGSSALEQKSGSSALEPHSYRAWWFEPRSGGATLIGEVAGDQLEFTPPLHAPDWVLVLDRLEAHYGVPGC